MLEGIKVIHLGGIGPGPFAAMVLADMGAQVTRIVRLGELTRVPIAHDVPHDILYRGQDAIEADLKNTADREAILDRLRRTHLVIEGFRPGVAERLRLGPAEAHSVNPALVYGRMTGWGQTGPLAQTAGHDINYIALSGALEPIAAPDGRPVPPLNFMGDFGGGSMYLVAGLLAGLVRAQTTGKGAVVDASILDGTANLTAMMHSFRKVGRWGERGKNLFDGGAPFYRVYETKDGKWMAMGAVEGHFFAQAMELLGLDITPEQQYDESQWAAQHAAIEGAFAERTQEEWIEVFRGTDACVTEVVAPEDVLDHPHLKARKTYTNSRGYIEPGVAPRFS